jgi:hypothetical protein
MKSEPITVTAETDISTTLSVRLWADKNAVKY